MIEIPDILKNENFRFILISKHSKIPLEEDWQNTNNYKFDDEKLLNHLSHDNNYGIVTGYGNLRVIDIDDLTLINDIDKKLNTLTIETGSGKRHYYILSNYNKNHVFKKSAGELRCNNYQVVCPNSIHPKTKSPYKILKNTDITYIEEKELLELLKDLLVTKENVGEENQVSVDKNYIEKNIFPTINSDIKLLITSNATKEILTELNIPSRSERDERVINHLLLRGWGSYVKSIFLLYPIGDKYQKQGDKYLLHSIKNARIYSGVDDDLFLVLDKEIRDGGILLKTKINEYLKRIACVKNTLLQNSLLSALAYKTGINKHVLLQNIKNISMNVLCETRKFLFADLISKDIQEPEYWIKPFIPKNCLAVIGGKPAAYKSMFILSAILSLKDKKHQKFLGKFETNHNSSPKILYYDLETGEDMQARRLQYLINGSNIEIEGSSDCVFKMFFNHENKETELEECKKYDIIILDSYRRFLKGDENQSDIINDFYREFLFPLREMKKTIIVIHHLKKGEIKYKDSRDLSEMFRGSGDIVANPDVMLVLNKEDDNYNIGANVCDFNVTVTKTKVRDVYPIKNFGFKVTRNDALKTTKHEFNAYVENISPKEEAKRDIIAIITREKEIKCKDLLILLDDEGVPGSHTTYIRHLRELVTERKICQNAYGTYSPIPANDREILV